VIDHIPIERDAPGAMSLQNDSFGVMRALTICSDLKAGIVVRDGPETSNQKSR